MMVQGRILVAEYEGGASAGRNDGSAPAGAGATSGSASGAAGSYAALGGLQMAGAGARSFRLPLPPRLAIRKPSTLLRQSRGSIRAKAEGLARDAVLLEARLGITATAEQVESAAVGAVFRVSVALGEWYGALGAACNALALDTSPREADRRTAPHARGKDSERVVRCGSSWAAVEADSKAGSTSTRR